VNGVEEVEEDGPALFVLVDAGLDVERDVELLDPEGRGGREPMER